MAPKTFKFQCDRLSFECFVDLYWFGEVSYDFAFKYEDIDEENVWVLVTYEDINKMELLEQLNCLLDLKVKDLVRVS